MKAMGKFEGNTHQPYSRLDSLTGIQYLAAIASKDFIYFASTQKAYDELLEALNDDSIHMIGLYGEGGCGKTTLATQVGKQAEDRKMFDKVILITVTQTPNIRAIQGQIADMLKMELKQESVLGRAAELWKYLKEKKRILIIGDSLWRELKLEDIGIFLDDNDIKKTWKVLITTRNERVFPSMDCQKQIDLELLSADDSWKLFQKFARIDDEDSKKLDDVPRKICNECMGLPIAIKIVGSLFRKRKEIEWQKAYKKLLDSKASDNEDNATLFTITLSYDHLPTQNAQQIFLLCALFPAEKHTPTEDLVRYAVGLGKEEISSLKSMRSSISADINDLLDSCLLTRGSVKMDTMVRDAALWIANRSDDCKILVNVDEPLSTVAEDNNTRDCFALSSWWFNENPSFCQLHAPNLKMLLVNISASSSLNSLDLFPLTFEGVEGLQVFSLTINYKIVPISFPPTIQKLTNVRTLRLNGLKLGDISFIVSLTALEVLDLRRCYFNELPIELRKLESLKLLDLSGCHFFEKIYNSAIGKCSQLEEVYASQCYPRKYANEIIMDIVFLQNLQRFVLGDPIIPERTRVVQVNDFNISKLTSNKNILQIAETISLKGLRGGSENIIPDMVGFVGGMNNLSTLHLNDYRGIECIFNTTCDFKEDDMIPRLVELRLKTVYLLTELYHGPPLQVLHFFEKLEVLDIDHCRKLHITFPRQCKLRNLKILSLSYCKTDEVLFSESIAQSLQQLEQLTIHGCCELKHIISASGSEDGDCSTSEEIVPAPTNSHFLMTNIRDVNIYDCQRLESIFPLCYVEGVPRLQKMHISHAPNLKYVFGKCDHEHLSPYQNLNQVMLPHLEVLKLVYLDNLIGMCPENYQANWPSQSLRILIIENCRKMAIPWFNLKAGYDQSQHHLNEIRSFQCLQYLTMGNCEELKSLFSMETHRSLPELMELRIYNCQELEQIVAANEEVEVVEIPNAELYFPKLKEITVFNCNKLKSLFPHSMVTMLPQLSTLHLSKATQLQEVFRHGQGDDIVDKMETVLPNLTQITLTDLPNFEDICHGCKLHTIELLQFNISSCPKIAPGLTKIQEETEEATEDSSSISNDVEDFIYFVSRQKAYDELFETLNDVSIHMIGLYGESGCGKTTLVNEVSKKAEDRKMFDGVISITVSQTPDIRAIQGQTADMLKLKLQEGSPRGRAQRILVIVDSLWREFNLKDIGICLDDFNKGGWKIIVITSDQHVCTLMNCQKEIHLGILSQDESWILFQKHAQVDDQFSDSMDGVARKLCDECNGLPITIKSLASSLKGKQNTEWESALAKLRDSEALDVTTHPLNCLKLCYDYLPRPEAQLLQVCSLYPQEHRIPTEDLIRCALGLGIQSNRSLIQTLINKLFESSMQMRGSVKINDMVRDTALVNRSDNCKILVNVDKPLSTVAEDNNITDCFAVSSWWYNEKPSFCQLHAPNLKMLLVNIIAHSSLNSLDLSPLTFEGIQGLEVFSLTINYKIVPISFPPSIQLLTNVRTLRLNGLKLGDISFIASLTSLEILDLRRCEFKELPIEIGNLRSLKLLDLSECNISEHNYNGAIGKCSQLEELYASKCYPYKYVHEIILDIGILQNLQRFVLGDPISPERTRVVQVNDFDISRLRTSNKNILQIAERISLKGLCGGSENIIPDMVGFVGGMNNLSTLHLTDCREIKCIFDTICDFQEDELIPRFVELHLKDMHSLTELFHGPPLQVLRFFEKLELLDIYHCELLRIIFPRQCNLQNLKILRLNKCKTDEVLFSESVAQSLQQLEQLTISGCNTLKHLIASGGCKHGGFNKSEEIIPAPTKSHFFMTNLREVKISSCLSLESIFPIFYVEGLPQLQEMDISDAPELKYVFGECDHVRLSSYQYQNHVLLPHLEALTLSKLPNLTGMCPEHCHAKWPPQSLWKLNIDNCGRLVTRWLSFEVVYDQRTHHLNENSPAKLKHLELSLLPNLYSISWVGPAPKQIRSFQCLQRLKVTGCYNLKCVFSMETHGSLPELMELCVYECIELKQIVAANAGLYFPKLKHIEISRCDKLKSLFPLSMVTMLPQLSTLDLSNAGQLQEVFRHRLRHSRSHNIMNTMEIVLPNLDVIGLFRLPNFVDICRGCKLHAVKLRKLTIVDCPNSARSLKQIQDEIKRSLISNKEDDSPLKDYYERRPRGSE